MTFPAAELLAIERATTSARIEALAREFDEIVTSSAITPPDDEHDPEGSTVAFERAQIAALLAQARSHLADIDRAEQRLRDGTYGTCRRCGGPIVPDRLLARPTAETCVRCSAG